MAITPTSNFDKNIDPATDPLPAAATQRVFADDVLANRQIVFDAINGLLVATENVVDTAALDSAIAQAAAEIVGIVGDDRNSLQELSAAIDSLGSTKPSTEQVIEAVNLLRTDLTAGVAPEGDTLAKLLALAMARPTSQQMNEAFALLQEGVDTEGNSLAKLYALILERATNTQLTEAVTSLRGDAPSHADTIEKLYSLLVIDSTITRYLDFIYIRVRGGGTTYKSAATITGFFDVEGNEYPLSDWVYEDGTPPVRVSLAYNISKTLKLKYVGASPANGLSKITVALTSANFSSLTLEFKDGISSYTSNTSALTPAQDFTTFKSDQSPIGLYRGTFNPAIDYLEGEMVLVEGVGLFTAKRGVPKSSTIPADGDDWSALNAPTEGVFRGQFSSFADIDIADPAIDDWVSVTTGTEGRPQGAYSWGGAAWSLLFDTTPAEPAPATPSLDSEWSDRAHAEHNTQGIVSYSQLDSWARVRESFVIAPTDGVKLGTQVTATGDVTFAEPTSAGLIRAAGLNTYVWNIGSEPITVTPPGGLALVSEQESTRPLAPGEMRGWALLARQGVPILRELPNSQGEIEPEVTYTHNREKGVTLTPHNESATIEDSNELVGPEDNRFHPFKLTIDGPGTWAYVDIEAGRETYEMYVKAPDLERLTVAFLGTGESFARVWDISTDRILTSVAVPTDSGVVAEHLTIEDRGEDGHYYQLRINSGVAGQLRFGSYGPDFVGFDAFPATYHLGIITPDFNKPPEPTKMQVVKAEWNPSEPVDLVPNRSISTGMDLSDIDLLWVAWEDDNLANSVDTGDWPSSAIDFRNRKDGSGFYIDSHSNAYLYFTLTDAANGVLRCTTESGRELRIVRMWTTKLETVNEVIPEGYLATQPYKITLDGAAFADGGDFKTAHTGKVTEIRVTVPDGKILASATATGDATASTTEAGVITVFQAWDSTGQDIEVTPAFADKPEPIVGTTYDHEYLESNGELVVFPDLPNVQFRFNSTDRQITLRCTDGVRRYFREAFGRWEQGGEAMRAIGTITCDTGWRNLVGEDVNFSVAGAGEYVMFTYNQRKYRVVAFVGHGWNGCLIELWSSPDKRG